MERRDFIKLLGGTATLGLLGGGNSAFAQEQQTPTPLKISSEKLMELFESDNPEVLRLTEKVLRDCILNKVIHHGIHHGLNLVRNAVYVQRECRH